MALTPFVLTTNFYVFLGLGTGITFLHQPLGTSGETCGLRLLRLLGTWGQGFVRKCSPLVPRGHRLPEDRPRVFSSRSPPSQRP